MTSLKDFIDSYLAQYGPYNISNESTEGYIKKLKEHMMKWRVLTGYSKDADYPIAVTIEEILRFLRGETSE